MLIVLATGNKGKIKELKEILSGATNDRTEIVVISSKEAGCVSNPEENGNTFEENAFIKAEEILVELLGKPEYKDREDLIVMADDSGLCVDALNGCPGIHSAYYAGDNATDCENVKKLLDELSGVPENVRQAKFVCAAVALYRDGRRFSETGEVHGVILTEPVGENGFGYDPIFFNKEFNKSFAELTDDEKNSISHRGRAFRELCMKLC